MRQPDDIPDWAKVEAARLCMIEHPNGHYRPEHADLNAMPAVRALARYVAENKGRRHA